jgi:hypothetical protein
MFLIYAFLGGFAFVIYRQLKSPAQVIVSEPATGPLGPSRRIVFTLAALFSLDSFGGGFFVQSLLALWLFDHFGLSLTAAGSLFSWLSSHRPSAQRRQASQRRPGALPERQVQSLQAICSGCRASGGRS